VLNITDEDKLFFKNVCDKKFTTPINFINISLLTTDDIVEKLKTNMISFNYIIDNDECVETVEPGWQTNGNYRNVENTFSHKYTPSLNIALAIDDLKDVSGVMFRLSKMLGNYAVSKRMRLVIGQNIFVNHTQGSGLIYKTLPDGYIVDVIFEYFRKLFV